MCVYLLEWYRISSTGRLLQYILCFCTSRKRIPQVGAILLELLGPGSVVQEVVFYHSFWPARAGTRSNQSEIPRRCHAVLGQPLEIYSLALRARAVPDDIVLAYEIPNVPLSKFAFLLDFLLDLLVHYR